MRAKDNPYRVEKVDSLPYVFADQDLACFYEHVKTHGYRGAIVGPHGSGKTTLLADLMQEFERFEIRYTHSRLRDDGYFENRQRLQKWIRSAPQESVLILDSAGLLKWWQWRSLQRKSQEFRGFLITSHVRGRLTTLIECHPKFETLKILIDRLDVVPKPSEKILKSLFTKHHGNIRDCLRELYDQTLESCS